MCKILKKPYNVDLKYTTNNQKISNIEKYDSHYIFVPFWYQNSPLNCGPTAVQMILHYFGFDECITKLAELGFCWPGTYSWPVELGLIVNVFFFFLKPHVFSEKNQKL